MKGMMLCKYIHRIVVIIAYFFMSGCNSYVDNQARLNLPIETKACVIIPGVGCDGCIAAGLDFIAKNKQVFENGQNECVVVFTAILSKKMLIRKLKEYEIENINMIIDKENSFLVDGYEQYPILCLIGEDDKQEMVVQTPDNPDALNRIFEILK